MEEDYKEIPKSGFFTDCLQEAAARSNLDYWSREDSAKANLPRETFLKAIRQIKQGHQFQRAPRQSTAGLHGRDGEDFVFSTTFEAELMPGYSRSFYFKGYFFTKERRIGLTVQSFRGI